MKRRKEYPPNTHTHTHARALTSEWDAPLFLGGFVFASTAFGVIKRDTMSALCTMHVEIEAVSKRRVVADPPSMTTDQVGEREKRGDLGKGGRRGKRER